MRPEGEIAGILTYLDSWVGDFESIESICEVTSSSRTAAAAARLIGSDGGAFAVGRLG